MKNLTIFLKSLLLVILILTGLDLWAITHENSVVEITLTTKLIHYYSPWKSGGTSQKVVMGTLLPDKLIMAPGLIMQNVSLIEVSKLGSNEKYFAEIVMKDPYSGIAFIKVDDDEFYEDLVPLELMPPKKFEKEEDISVLQWNSKGAFESFSCKYIDTQGMINFSAGFMLLHRFSASANDLNSGSPVIVNDQCAGMTFTYYEGTVIAIASDQILRIIDHINNYPGLPFWVVEIDPLENDKNLRRYLNLGQDDKGVYITNVPKASSGSQLLEAGDIILKIDGKNIDDRGLYDHPLYSKIPYFVSIFLEHFAGDKLELTISRSGKRKQVSIPLISLEQAKLVIEPLTHEGKDEYYIFGGLLFQKLSRGYLTNWGSNWGQDADSRLLYYYSEYWASPNPQRQEIVLLNRILETSFNRGYIGFKNRPLISINGKKIKDLKSLKEIIESSKDEFLVFKFVGNKELVLNRKKAIEENKSILKAYDISKSEYFQE